MSIGVLINHAITFVTSPLSVALALIILGSVLAALCRTGRLSRFGRLAAAGGVAWLWFMSTGLANRWLGLGLEREFPPARVEELPQADAIALLGGGVGSNTNTVFYSELYMAGDRVVHAARIWKAGKAPLIIPSGCGELHASLPLLRELGVPEESVLVENQSGNTEENAKFVAEFLSRRAPADGDAAANPAKPRVLLVTSAWHMRRSLLLFRKYAPGLEVIPAACDYEATVHSDDFRLWRALLPDADALMHNTFMLKEHIGYWGYRLLR